MGVEPGKRLGEFTPELAPSTNGHRRRFRVLPGVLFGVLTGSLLATNLVPRLQWLNLAQVGSWQRPVGVSLAAGAMVGLLRRDDARAAVVGGAIAAVVSLWGVYALMRASTRVLFVDRSVARVVAADAARLLAYAGPAGALGARLAWMARSALARRTAAGGRPLDSRSR